MTKYYIDKDGNYIGGFNGENQPKGAIEVKTPPDDARQKHDGKKWLDRVISWKEAREAEFKAEGWHTPYDLIDSYIADPEATKTKRNDIKTRIPKA